MVSKDGAVILSFILYILLCMIFGLGGLILRLGDVGGDDGLVGAVFLVVVVDFVFFDELFFDEGL